MMQLSVYTRLSYCISVVNIPLFACRSGQDSSKLESERKKLEVNSFVLVLVRCWQCRRLVKYDIASVIDMDPRVPSQYSPLLAAYRRSTKIVL